VTTLEDASAPSHVRGVGSSSILQTLQSNYPFAEYNLYWKEGMDSIYFGSLCSISDIVAIYSAPGRDGVRRSRNVLTAQWWMRPPRRASSLGSSASSTLEEVAGAIITSGMDSLMTLALGKFCIAAEFGLESAAAMMSSPVEE
jgi:hypothetical protein